MAQNPNGTNRTPSGLVVPDPLTEAHYKELNRRAAMIAAAIRPDYRPVYAHITKGADFIMVELVMVPVDGRIGAVVERFPFSAATPILSGA